MAGRFLSAVLLALAVTACSDLTRMSTETSEIPSSPVFGVTVTQTHTDFGPFVTMNPCQPEPVSFSGKVHRTVKTRDDGTIEVRTNFAGLKGVGLVTGNEYVLQQNSALDILDPPPPPIAQTLRLHTRVISRGGADNFHVTVEQTVTSPPLVVVVDIKSVCNG